MGESQNIGTTALYYSLPRLITTSLSTIFNTYLGQFYIHTYQWNPEDYGKLTSTYTATLFICYLIIGLIINYSTKDRGNEETQLNIAKSIEASAVFIHVVSFFFLIILPLRWSGIRPHLFYIFSRHLSSDSNNILRSSICMNTENLSPVLLDTGLSAQCILCFNNRFCNALLRFIESILRLVKSKRFVIYLLAALHGVGFSSLDLCNRAIPTYIEKEKSNLKTINGINLFIYAGTMLGTNIVISIIKFFFDHVISETELYIIISVILLLCQVPILGVFICCTNKEEKKDAGKSQDSAKQPGSSGSSSEETIQKSTEPGSQQDEGSTKCSNIAQYCKLFSVFAFHGSIDFWITTGGPLVQYVSMYVLNGNVHLKTFGPLVLLVSSIATTGSYIIYNHVTSESGKPKEDQQSPSSKPCNDKADKIIMGICIPIQTFIYLLFFRHDWSWNRGSWFNFLLLAICGSSYGLFLLTVNSMFDTLVKYDIFKKDKWNIIGGFFSYTQLLVSFSVYILYKSYDKNKLIEFGLSRLRFSFIYSFTSVYKILTGMFQSLNIIAALVYFLTGGD